ncbi:hypothetical protein ILYODFUR_032679 [Ilyodon furcidens]|uniref:Uncharacterized protein n=1 Tax=Ilyodon furcidens TaxID=33524 RepID=A0ABV0T266_9TELE
MEYFYTREKQSVSKVNLSIGYSKQQILPLTPLSKDKNDFSLYCRDILSCYVAACDYLGERMASLFGITSAKYQYAIDEYHRIKKEKEEEKEENRLSEEAEQTFDQLQSQEGKDEPITSTKGQEGVSACPDVTYQVENENPAAPTTITVPVIVTAT